ncbi:MAG: helix-turn-helix domain-containing protein [Clostridiaceae bacterium]|nr:helix-turn-helix domain-containing protein [Clostridiaceae bacterium]
MKGYDYLDLADNYYALCEAILRPDEVPVDVILHKYGLLPFTPKDMRRVKAQEMKRQYVEENLTYEEVAKRFSMSPSGAYRKIKRWGG